MLRANPVRVTKEVFEGIDAVRRSGRTNTLDLAEVVKIAREMGFIDAANWIESNRLSYGRGVLFGFLVLEGGS